MAGKEHRKQTVDRRANRTVLWRTILLLALFGVAVFIPLLVQLWDIQITNQDYYEMLAIEQQTGSLTVEADRGTIYDSTGQILAISGTVYKVVLSPRSVLELQENYTKAVEKAAAAGKALPSYPEPTYDLIADGLAEILGVSRESVIQRLERTNRMYEVVQSKVEEEQADQVRAFIAENHLATGVFLEPDTMRYYPNSSLASHLLGFVNAEYRGAYGLEAKYDDELSGEAGRIVTAKNATGTEMISRYENYIDKVDGYEMKTTLNATIQAMLESTLQEGIETYDIRYGGFGIVMDPDTGAIYAMASTPEFDLNNYTTIVDGNLAQQLEQLKSTATEEEYLKALGNAQLQQWRNKAVSDTYEPGSTFKSMVLAAALEEGVVSERDHFFCSGSVTVAGEVIRCSDRSGHGDQTLAQAVENSCNPAFIAIGQRLGAEKFYDYLESFGQIGKTGIDLPAEANNENNENLVWSREYFTGPYGLTSLATASFGQRLNVTPIQLITGVAATVNGGYLLEPYVVERLSDGSGNTVYQHEVTQVRQVISGETSEKVRTILEGVVDGGTGKNAYTAGYRIGGKTGTSETLDDDRNIVSFVGFAPADDPEVIVLLAYDGPARVAESSNYTEDGYYISGGWMAAPMAGKLIADVMDYMGVDKQYTADELSGADTMVPKLTGHYLDYAASLVEQAGLTWRTVGEGSVVTGQIPAQGATIPGNSQVVLYLGDEPVPDGQVEVPELEGLSPEEVQRQLTAVGLYMRASGSSDYYESSNKAVNQSIAAGVMVDVGTVIEVRFVDGTIIDYGGY